MAKLLANNSVVQLPYDQGCIREAYWRRLAAGLLKISLQLAMGYVLEVSTAIVCSGITFWNGWQLSENRPYRYLDLFGIRIRGVH